MAHYRPASSRQPAGQLFPQTYGFEDTAEQTDLGFDAAPAPFYTTGTADGAAAPTYFFPGPASPPGSQGHVHTPAAPTSGSLTPSLFFFFFFFFF